MTGWRIGWMVAGRALGAAAAALISHSTQCPATFAQVPRRWPWPARRTTCGALVEEYRRRLDAMLPGPAGHPRRELRAPGRRLLLLPERPAAAVEALPTTRPLGRAAARASRPGAGARGGLRRARLPAALVRTPGRRAAPRRRAWPLFLGGSEASLREPSLNEVELGPHAGGAVPARAQGEGLGHPALAGPGRGGRARPGPVGVRGLAAAGGAPRTTRSGRHRCSTPCTGWSASSATRRSGRSRAVPSASVARSGATCTRPSASRD